MPIPVRTVFRRMARDNGLATDIAERFDKLGRFCTSIQSGRVIVERPERHHRVGNRVHVRLAIVLSGEEIVIDHRPGIRKTIRARGAKTVRKQDEVDRAHPEATTAVREAFEAARRRLQDWARRLREPVSPSRTDLNAAGSKVWL